MQVEYIDHMGNDESIVLAARVSFAGDDYNDRTKEQNTNLIKYLAKHNHWTPFAHTSITLRVRAPVPIRTQCFKHKQGFVENEESRRYISSEPTFFFPEWRSSTANKKQGSGGEVDVATKFKATDIYCGIIEKAEEAYIQLLNQGIAEEQARFVLPQGTEVNWYWTGSLAAYARFCKQRMDPHAQKEIQELAQEISNIIKPLYPVAWEELTGVSHEEKES